MPELAYIFERFPSFTQTFCYREVAELIRQGLSPKVFSIRRPEDEPPQSWNRDIVAGVQYLPDEAELTREVTQLLRNKKLPVEATKVIEEWGRQPDFLRLYQAAYIGMRLRDTGIRHVHAHFAGMATRTAYWIDRFFGITFSFTAHANDIFAPRAFVITLADLIEAARRVITVSDYAVNFLQERFPGRQSKIHRIYNGIDLSRFTLAPFDAKPPLIISVGRLIEKKGFHVLINACAMLKARGRQFHCEIIGDGPLEDALRAQIRRSQLDGQVTLAGPLSEVEVTRRLAAATLFALPCVVEKDGGMDNLPTVIMEAMAAGLPVVSTTIAGVPEMVENGRTGLLVRPNDVAALAGAMEELIGDIPRARQLGSKGRAVARERFAIERTVSSLRELLEAVA